MAITLADVKVYLRIDSDVEDALLTKLMAVSGAVLKGAVDNYDLLISLKPQLEEKGDMVQLTLIADLYENRNLEGQAPQSYSRVVETMLHQLQYESDLSADELQALIDEQEDEPAEEPTEEPSGEPTGEPTGEPSGEPTGDPTTPGSDDP
jgi:uncharacterized phage protein (predicted DNA packaging)